MNFLRLSILICVFALPVVCSSQQCDKTDSVQLVGQARVAMCQIFCLDSDREGNYVRIENALKKAKALDVDIACFPETSLLGWINPIAHDIAEPIPGNDSDRLRALAVKYKIHICIGLAEKDEDKLYDSAILIDDEGKIILKHRKVNVLTHLMDPPYSKGTSASVVDTKFGRIGILICADTFDDKVLAMMAEKKPDLLLVPYGWAAKEKQWPDHGKSLAAVVKNAARNIGCTLVGTDLVGAITSGSSKGSVYGGQSVASDKNGNIVAQCCDRDSDIQVVGYLVPSK